MADRTIRHEIFFDDLTEGAQKELLKFHGVDNVQEINADIESIAIFERVAEEQGIDTELRDQYIKEIVELNPFIINIGGSWNPTYTSDSFSYCLVDYHGYLTQFSGGYASRYSCEAEQLVNITKHKWLKNIIEEFEYLHNTSLFKYKDKYYIFDTCGEPIEQYLDDEGELIIDVGGYVELIQKPKTKLGVVV